MFLVQFFQYQKNQCVQLNPAWENWVWNILKLNIKSPLSEKFSRVLLQARTGLVITIMLRLICTIRSEKLESLVAKEWNACDLWAKNDQVSNALTWRFWADSNFKNSKNYRFQRNKPEFGIWVFLLARIKHEFFQF